MTLQGPGAAFTLDAERTAEIHYEVEANQGYESTGDLWSPGSFRVELIRGTQVALIASTESWETLGALQLDEALRAEHGRRARLIAAADPEAREGIAAELVLAADQFLITPAGRVEDTASAHAAGEEIRSVIAGYHWFTDWGRDTMISLEGLTLMTGRYVEAGYILRTFASYIRDGLIPNFFPDGKTQGVYHTADATLWFFHAIDRYLDVTHDRATLAHARAQAPRHRRAPPQGHPVRHRRGLARRSAPPGPGGLPVDLDGRQGRRLGDYVAARQGSGDQRALVQRGTAARRLGPRGSAASTTPAPWPTSPNARRRAFNEQFWFAEGGYLYDVIDGERGDDPSCRPNQILALSLRHPILERSRWELVVEVVRRQLLTPVGLRSLAPGHADYKPKYLGDLRARDAAYHQGTVWGWLIGPFIDAWLKLHPEDRVGARRFLEGFVPHLGEACLGSISEIFDAEDPFTPRGCIAQAWSVAEVLRCWVKTAG